MALTLQINKIRKSFKRKSVLKEIDLEASGSEIIGLIGKSGCGKSTLMKILVGYFRPDSGTIYVNGRNISYNIKELRRMVGYTTQENSFYEKLSVIENMRYYSNLYGIKRKLREERITNLLTQVGLIDHKRSLAEQLSGGMKRRLDFAISLLHDPKILILDEPTTGLDPLLIDQFWRIVLDVAARDEKIVLVSSHILPEIESYCTKVAVMNEGKIVHVLNKRQMVDLEDKFRAIVDKEGR